MTVHREQSMKREDQQDATIRCLLLTSVSTCFGHHYAHLKENKGPVTAFDVLFWFCWMLLVAVVERCVVGFELTSVSTCFGHHYVHLQENKGPFTAFCVLFWFCWMWLVAVVGRCLVGCEQWSSLFIRWSSLFIINFTYECFIRRKSAISCVMSVTSIFAHGTTLLPPDGFSWNLIFEDLKENCLENSRFIKI